MVAGLLGNESSDSNRFTLVTPKSENDVRLQATLGNQNPTGLPVGVVRGHEESLPHYKNKNIIIPKSLLKQVQSLKNRDKLTIHTVSGETIKYQLEVIGKVDQLSKSIPALYCKNGSSYYCINLIKV